jgi:hypothetical protein
MACRREFLVYKTIRWRLSGQSLGKFFWYGGGSFFQGRQLTLQAPGNARDGIPQDLAVYFVRSSFADDVYGD